MKFTYTCTSGTEVNEFNNIYYQRNIPQKATSPLVLSSIAPTCSSTSVLSFFHANVDSGFIYGTLEGIPPRESLISYEYSCLNITGTAPLQCRNLVTEWSKPFSSAKIQCNSNEALSSWKLNNDQNVNPITYKYEYVCCSFTETVQVSTVLFPETLTIAGLLNKLTIRSASIDGSHFLQFTTTAAKLKTFFQISTGSGMYSYFIIFFIYKCSLYTDLNII